MLRALLGVIVGFFVGLGVVEGGNAAIWKVFGVDALYKEGVWEVTFIWIILSIVLYVIAGLFGGGVCEVVASKGTRAAILLAGVVLVAGSLEAGKLNKNMDEQEQTARQVEATRFDAMQYARVPALARFGSPLLAAIGILVGGEIIRRKGAAPVT